ncbi:ornithine cyclodeaminase family protein [Burkholderia glumae]|uniref:ornithine cyclodeaminase family protein n=1 Tax=Burkholderia glumae TaxID=337 RepID=UPI0012F8669B|nr:ornithine cyclodeaminase family protein [Burkholderia glumae]
MLHLNFEDVLSAMPMIAAIDTLHRAFLKLPDTTGIFPARSIFELSQKKGNYGVVMPASWSGHGFGVKVSTITPANASRVGLNLIDSAYLLFHEETGQLQALIDGRALTYLRTGAISALSAKLLSVEHSSRLALIGTGLQARSHVESLLRVRPISQVRVHGRTAIAARKFCEGLAERYESIDFTPAPSVSEAVMDADIVCMTTSTADPEGFLVVNELPKHVHVCAIGGRTLDACEAVPSSLRGVSVFVDDIEPSIRESAELRLALASGILATSNITSMAQIVRLPAERLHELRTRRSYFRSVGIPLQDIAIAKVIVDKCTSSSARTLVN